MGLDLAELKTELESNIRISSGETGVYGSDTFRTEILNRGCSDFVRRTNALRTYGTITSVDGTAEYNLITNFSTFLKIDPEGGVTYNGKVIVPTTMEEMDRDLGDSWHSASEGTPDRYYIRNNQLLGLYPTPSTSSLNIIVYYIYRPTDMSLTTDYPFTNTWLTEYYEAPLLYASWKLLIRGRQLEEAAMYKQEFLSLVNDCKREIRTLKEQNFNGIKPNMSIYRRR